jgi:acylphosphatase
MSAARHVFVSGRVQGVGFRWHAVARAEALALSGWIKNLDDGRVEAWLEGPSRDVEEMLSWLRSGPSGARVTGVQAREVAPRGLFGFEVHRTAHGA